MGKETKAAAWQRRADIWEDSQSVEDSDAVEAAVASGCSCLPRHCPALSTMPPRRPRVVLAPWVDQGEGPEA